jgi:alpha-ketoglutarate-dependent taurine dioxygenase
MQLAPGFGRIIERGDSPELPPADLLRKEAMAAGVVLLRGFQMKAARFAALADALCEQRGAYGGRKTTHAADASVEAVNPGTHSMTQHAEMAYVPFRPDLLLFWCERPATDGGETTLCDGVQVWERLSEPTRAAFTAQKVVYHWRAGPRVWRQTFAAGDAAPVIAELSSLPGSKVWAAPDDFLVGDYATPAQFPTPAGAVAFANSVAAWMPRSAGGDRWVVFEDGSEIPDAMRDELHAALEAVVYAHRWLAGDVLLIDNWRVTHGRRAFTGERLIFTRMGYTAACRRPGYPLPPSLLASR